mmetsp:Transcript_26768/g.79502  ORF Transcript_26768/g.79502 Transcript_26768/m.79502 type:complete len:327 (-) Transcript_26768:336-1316(-)
MRLPDERMCAVAYAPTSYATKLSREIPACSARSLSSLVRLCCQWPHTFPDAAATGPATGPQCHRWPRSLVRCCCNGLHCRVSRRELPREPCRELRVVRPSGHEEGAAWQQRRMLRARSARRPQAPLRCPNQRRQRSRRCLLALPPPVRDWQRRRPCWRGRRRGCWSRRRLHCLDLLAGAAASPHERPTAEQPSAHTEAAQRQPPPAPQPPHRPRPAAARPRPRGTAAQRAGATAAARMHWRGGRTAGQAAPATATLPWRAASVRAASAVRRARGSPPPLSDATERCGCLPRRRSNPPAHGFRRRTLLKPPHPGPCRPPPLAASRSL